MKQEWSYPARDFDELRRTLEANPDLPSVLYRLARRAPAMLEAIAEMEDATGDHSPEFVKAAVAYALLPRRESKEAFVEAQAALSREVWGVWDLGGKVFCAGTVGSYEKASTELGAYRVEFELRRVKGKGVEGT